jgi:hypothetical protein
VTSWASFLISGWSSQNISEPERASFLRCNGQMGERVVLGPTERATIRHCQ